MLVKDNGGPKFLRKESENFHVNDATPELEEKHPTRISEKASIMSKCVEKGL